MGMGEDITGEDIMVGVGGVVGGGGIRLIDGEGEGGLGWMEGFQKTRS